ncbi:hypothetical protein [Yersinia phage MHG19]|nr:hypothetical protein [Yersinia phage MHG19]
MARIVVCPETLKEELAEAAAKKAERKSKVVAEVVNTKPSEPKDTSGMLGDSLDRWHAQNNYNPIPAKYRETYIKDEETFW